MRLIIKSIQKIIKKENRWCQENSEREREDQEDEGR